MSNTIKTSNQPDRDELEKFQIYRFGIMVNSLDMSQKCFYIVKQLNELVDQSYRFSPYVFYKEYAKSVDVNRFCSLQDKEAWAFDAPVIATDLESAQTLIHLPQPTRKFFYVWNLEWIFNNYTYGYLQDLYQNDELELIARNESHADLITKCWKKPVDIMDNFDYNILQKIAKNTYNIYLEDENDRL